MDFQVIIARGDALLFVDSLQRKNAEQLSFYPKQVFERESAKGRILLALLGGEPAGYLYFGALGGNVKCHQVCIEYDARRRLYGAALVARLESEAERAQSASITLRCGFDLEANSFWREMGYSCVGHQLGGARRMRTINIWRKNLQPMLIEPAVVIAANGQTDASAWAKSGIRSGSRFARGPKLQNYRQLVRGSAGG